MSFGARGGPWPEHCVQDTPGASLRADLALPPEVVILSKGTDPDRDAYSAFDGTDLASLLRRAGVQRLWIGGLALDVCVRATALDAVKAGFEARLIGGATRPVSASAGLLAVEELRRAGVVIV